MVEPPALPSRATAKVAFTVDVESDWGSRRTQGLDIVLPRLLDLLQRHGASATFFVVGEHAEAFAAHVAAAGPHEVGSHGLTHRVLTRLPAGDVAHEIAESKRRLTACGYRVRGFRAPFLRRPRGLDAALAAAGYTYDSSGGSVVPVLGQLAGIVRRRQSRDGIRHLDPSVLRDRLTPFSLTWLRLYQPLGLRLVPHGAAVFCCHLHELLDEPGGWVHLAHPLRRLHARHTGRTAWRIIESLLALPRRFVPCAAMLGLEDESEKLRRPPPATG